MGLRDPKPGGSGDGSGALYAQYSKNGTDWHASRNADDLFGRISHDNTTWRVFLLDTVANIETVTTPTAKHKIGFDNQGRLFGVRHNYRAGTDATFEGFDIVSPSGNYIGEFYGEPYRDWTVGEEYYDYKVHLFKECIDVITDVGDIEIPVFRDEEITDVFGSTAVFLGERRTQQEAANHVSSYSASNSYYAFIGGHLRLMDNTNFVEAVSKIDNYEWILDSGLPQNLSDLIQREPTWVDENRVDFASRNNPIFELSKVGDFNTIGKIVNFTAEQSNTGAMSIRHRIGGVLSTAISLRTATGGNVPAGTIPQYATVKIRRHSTTQWRLVSVSVLDMGK